MTRALVAFQTGDTRRRIPKDHLALPEGGMRCTIACAIALPLVLAGCGEPVEPASDVARRGKLVKMCPNLRAVYTWQGKLYVKDGERYHQVERTRRRVVRHDRALRDARPRPLSAGRRGTSQSRRCQRLAQDLHPFSLAIR